MAPLLLSYGKALYELAFSTQGVMGKEEVEKTALAPGQLVDPFLPSADIQVRSMEPLLFPRPTLHSRVMAKKTM
jgi:hypothetical protein